MERLTQRYESIVIGDRDFTNQGIDFTGEEVANVTSDGWDTLKIPHYIYSATKLTAESLSLRFPAGWQLQNRQFWIVGYEGPRQKSEGLYEVNVQYKGIAQAKPIVVTTGATANESNVENVNINGNVYSKANVYEPSVTAQARYVITDLSSAPTATVGTASTPPSAPATPPHFWSYLADYTFNYPNGWVLMSSNVEPIPGTQVAFVTDSYQYIQAFIPS